MGHGRTVTLKQRQVRLLKVINDSGILIFEAPGPNIRSRQAIRRVSQVKTRTQPRAS